MSSSLVTGVDVDDRVLLFVGVEGSELSSATPFSAFRFLPLAMVLVSRGLIRSGAVKGRDGDRTVRPFSRERKDLRERQFSV